MVWLWIILLPIAVLFPLAKDAQSCGLLTFIFAVGILIKIRSYGKFCVVLGDLHDDCCPLCDCKIQLRRFSDAF